MMRSQCAENNQRLLEPTERHNSEQVRNILRQPTPVTPQKFTAGRSTPPLDDSFPEEISGDMRLAFVQHPATRFESDDSDSEPPPPPSEPPSPGPPTSEPTPPQENEEWERCRHSRSGDSGCLVSVQIITHSLSLLIPPVCDDFTRLLNLGMNRASPNEKASEERIVYPTQIPNPSTLSVAFDSTQQFTLPQNIIQSYAESTVNGDNADYRRTQPSSEPNLERRFQRGRSRSSEDEEVVVGVEGAGHPRKRTEAAAQHVVDVDHPDTVAARLRSHGSSDLPNQKGETAIGGRSAGHARPTSLNAAGVTFPDLSLDLPGTEDSPSAWMDASECSVDAKQSIKTSPLFVPTLNSTESTVETDKNGKQTVKVVGKTLMPCGLLLEVFEWDSSKNVEGKSELVDLSTSTATHWNETKIMIPFSAGDVAELNRKMEWRGRLVFGNGLRTSNWMVVSGLSSGNKSLGGVGSKWWIAVIISLSCALLVSVMIVVCVCLRRKRHSTRNEHLKNEEMSPAQIEEDEKMEEPDSITDQSNSAITSVPSAKDKHGNSFGETRFGSEEVIARGQSCVEVIVCNEKMERSVALETDTLFNALHNGHSPRFVEKGKVGSGIARGLVRLVEMKVMADVLTRLSPHWVLFDTNDRVSLKMREGQSVVLGSSGIVSGGMKTSEDGQRWMAPEVLDENWKATLENADHGAVFSLGLVLWEIETGCVPFGEVDGATAQRRLASDEKPVMEKVSSSMEAIILPCLSLDPTQ
ncbi:hypothetical protein BLNAU_4261 [Blattamonas nauphoetae]|uniref:Serine-threonine/tyrosine-protein kinase catalytic domain-containing protein n=1 Tax=Blattamonas nauphoetae TaxID=2049346 RepID=A0ABQ9YAX3_9EUKA|nr:hypothetical protein BLNAU_4261 [Blattamonas nauphoetae]